MRREKLNYLGKSHAQAVVANFLSSCNVASDTWVCTFSSIPKSTWNSSHVGCVYNLHNVCTTWRKEKEHRMVSKSITRLHTVQTWCDWCTQLLRNPQWPPLAWTCPSSAHGVWTRLQRYRGTTWKIISKWNILIFACLTMNPSGRSRVWNGRQWGRNGNGMIIRRWRRRESRNRRLPYLWLYSSCLTLAEP